MLGHRAAGAGVLARTAGDALLLIDGINAVGDENRTGSASISTRAASDAIIGFDNVSHGRRLHVRVKPPRGLG